MRVAFTVCCCTLAWVGCARDSTGSTSERDAASPLTAGDVSISALLLDYNRAAEGDTTLADVEICLDDRSRCTTSDRAGRFVIDGLEPEREIVLTFRRDGFVPTLMALVTPRWSSTLGILYLPHGDGFLDSYNAALHRAGRPELDRGASSNGLPAVIFSVLNGFSWRIHVHLEPDRGSDPFYQVDGRLELEIPEGQFAVLGGYLNVPPGEDYELVFEDPDGECRFYPRGTGGWPSKSGRANAIRVPVRESFLNYESVADCPLTITDAGSP